MCEDACSKDLCNRLAEIIAQNEDALIDKHQQDLLESDDNLKIIDAAKLIKVSDESKDLWNAIAIPSIFGDTDSLYIQFLSDKFDSCQKYIVIDSCKAPEMGYSLCEAIDLINNFKSRKTDLSNESDIRSRLERTIKIAHERGISDIEICKFIDYLHYYHYNNDVKDFIKYCKDKFNIEYKCTIDKYSTRFMIVGECPDKKLSKFTFRDLIRKYAVVHHDDKMGITWFLITHRQKFFEDNRFLVTRRDSPIVNELARVGGASFSLYHYSNSDSPDAEAEVYSIRNTISDKLLLAYEDDESINSELVSVICSLTASSGIPVDKLSIIGFLTLLNRIERAFGI